MQIVTLNHNRIGHIRMRTLNFRRRFLILVFPSIRILRVLIIKINIILALFQLPQYGFYLEDISPLSHLTDLENLSLDYSFTTDFKVDLLSFDIVFCPVI